MRMGVAGPGPSGWPGACPHSALQRLPEIPHGAVALGHRNTPARLHLWDDSHAVGGMVVRPMRTSLKLFLPSLPHSIALFGSSHHCLLPGSSRRPSPWSHPSNSPPTKKTRELIQSQQHSPALCPSSGPHCLRSKSRLQPPDPAQRDGGWKNRKEPAHL